MEQKKENVKWLYHNSTDQLCATEPTIGPIVLSRQLYELDLAIHHEVTRTLSDYCEVKRSWSSDSMTIQEAGIKCMGQGMPSVNHVHRNMSYMSTRKRKLGT